MLSSGLDMQASASNDGASNTYGASVIVYLSGANVSVYILCSELTSHGTNMTD